MQAEYLRLQIHTFRLCNTHCFAVATMVSRTRLNVTLYYIACLVLQQFGHQYARKRISETRISYDRK